MFEQLVFSGEIFGPIEVFFRTNHEFEFAVDNGKIRIRWEVFYIETVGSTRIGCFDVDNLLYALIDSGAVKRSTCFKRDIIAEIAKVAHQDVNIGLEQRLSTRDADVLCAVGLNFSDNGFDGTGAALVVGVGRVAIPAAEIAARRADEHGRPSDPRGLALNAVENLIDLDHGSWATNGRY